MVPEQLIPHLVRSVLLTAAIALLVGGCAAKPSPADTTGVTSAPQPTEEIQSKPSPADADPPRNTGSATLALVQQSRRAQSNGSLLEAIAYTERAIRIERRRADLWIRLAELELANAQPQIAIQHAHKALALAGGRVDWQRDAWLVIADAKAALGESAEAAAIREKWQTLRG